MVWDVPYLFLTYQMKREDMTKPYDAKKSFWVPDGEGGFVCTHQGLFAHRKRALW